MHHLGIPSHAQCSFNGSIKLIISGNSGSIFHFEKVVNVHFESTQSKDMQSVFV